MSTILPVCCVVLLGFLAVSVWVSEPYMDEEFHVAQFERIQSFVWKRAQWEWDPAITTFPGLYFLTSTIMGPWTSSLPLLRAVNAIGVNLGTWLVVKGLTGKSSVASAVVLYPLNFFFSLLYYTDSVSTFFVLLTMLLMKKRRFYLSGMIGGLSVLMRQTNIVWIFGLCLSEWIHRSFNLSIVWDLWPHIVVGIAFVVFVLQNGSIVLGHQQYHSFSLHLAQSNYFVLTAVGACGPSEWISMAKRFKFSPFFGLLILSAVLSAIYGTVEHPFILSDNRHYSFYFYKYFVSRYWMIRSLVIPLLVAASISASRILNPPPSRTSNMPNAILWFCTLLCIVPTPLIEFRYFNIPISLLICRSGLADSSLKGIQYFFLLVNVVTVYVFVFRPFRGVDGALARFMY